MARPAPPAAPVAPPPRPFAYTDYLHSEADLAARIGARRFGRWLTIVLGLCLVSLLAWAHFSTIDEITRGDGKVIPTGQNKVVQHQLSEAGRVVSVAVKEGDTVRQGQVLMRIDATPSEAEYKASLNKYLALRARAARLRAEALGAATMEFPDDVNRDAAGEAESERILFRSRAEQRKSELSVLERQREQREQQVRESQSTLKRLEERMRFLQQEFAIAQRDFRSGVISRSELQEIERAFIETRGQLATEQSALPRYEAAKREADEKLADKKAAILADIRKELNETQGQIDALKPTVERLDTARKLTDLVAPTNGVIKVIGVRVGENVTYGRPLVEIVPVENTLLVEVKIKPKDVAFLRKDLPATIKISTYDYSIYGGIEGKVAEISADSLQEEKRQPGAKEESFYRVRIRADRDYLERNGVRLPITTGMTAQVDITTGKRSVLDQILGPIYRTINEALRER